MGSNSAETGQQEPQPGMLGGDGLGARSMLSFQLFVEGDHLGTLNLFGDDSGVFDSESERIGALVAAHAAVSVAGSRQVSQLTEALRSVVEQLTLSGEMAPKMRR